MILHITLEATEQEYRNWLKNAASLGVVWEKRMPLQTYVGECVGHDVILHNAEQKIGRWQHISALFADTESTSLGECTLQRYELPGWMYTLWRYYQGEIGLSARRAKWPISAESALVDLFACVELPVTELDLDAPESEG